MKPAVAPAKQKWKQIQFNQPKVWMQIPIIINQVKYLYLFFLQIVINPVDCLFMFLQKLLQSAEIMDIGANNFKLGRQFVFT